MEFAVFLRLVLIVGMILVIAAMVGQTTIAWKHISLGQKFFVIGALSWILYGTDAMREAISVGIGWRPRLILAIIGLLSLVFYVMEPMSLGRHRWGKKKGERPEDLAKRRTSTPDDTDATTDYRGAPRHVGEAPSRMSRAASAVVSWAAGTVRGR